MTAVQQTIEQEIGSLRQQAQSAVQATGAEAEVEILRGRPADALLKLAENVDLLVIGSRRWGAMARLVLGSTGEALMHGASCSVLVVPRPQD